MKQEIFKLDSDFQPYLLNGDYTFVGPSNANLLDNFIKQVNMIAPTSFFSTIHDALSNKEAVQIAVNNLPENTPLRVYIIVSPAHSEYLIHASIEDYCTTNTILFKP